MFQSFLLDQSVQNGCMDIGSSTCPGLCSRKCHTSLQSVCEVERGCSRRVFWPAVSVLAAWRNISQKGISFVNHCEVSIMNTGTFCFVRKSFFTSGSTRFSSWMNPTGAGLTLVTKGLGLFVQTALILPQKTEVCATSHQILGYRRHFCRESGTVFLSWMIAIS